jgi:WD40 repeat protein
MKARMLLLLLLSCVFFSFAVSAQDCKPPQIVANSNTNNMFSPEQETVLGNMTFQRMSSDFRFVRNDKLLAYVNEIGDKLITHLPPTGLKFQFHLIDIPEVNAFNIPGGHVFVSRKLVAFADSEDELAGVIAHELGHAAVHHGALDMSEYFRKVLKVEKLGDRKDVEDKYNLLIENARTKTVLQRRSHEDAQQIEADKIGLFAMVAAGYDPNAFTRFFDRLAETEGKTGSWWSNIFGKTRPDQKRLKEMIQLTEKLPPNCRQRNSATTDKFQNWQAELVSFRETNRQEELPALLWKKELNPKLRSDIQNFIFSKDGKILLVQDDFNLTLIEREPMRVVFQIPADDVKESLLTDDGKNIVFVTNNLRFERWDIAEKKPVEIKELVLRRDCWESKLSPDGKTLACIDTSTKINLIDTKTGKRIYEKKEFYQLNFLEYIRWIASGGDDSGGDGVNFFRIGFTPDSRYVTFSRSDRFRFRVRVDAFVVDQTENTTLALDLTTLKTIEVGKDLKKVLANAYSFLDSERVIGMISNKIEDSGIFSFPNGKRISKFNFYARQIKPTGNPDYLIIKPLGNAQMGVFDVNKKIVAAGLNKADATVWNNLMVYETAAGKVLFREVAHNEKEQKFDGKDVGTLEIPVGSIGNLNTTQISDQFNWIILSSKTRGGLWNLETGERKIFLRGFQTGIVVNDGTSVAQFPGLDKVPRSLVFMNPKDSSTVPILELPEQGARQYGRFVLYRKSLAQAKKKENDKSTELIPDESESVNLTENVKFELLDISQNKTIWSRDFPKQSPRFSFDIYSGRMLFYWRLGSESGKEKLKENPEIKAQAEKLGNRDDDYLVEVVDAFAQKTVGTLLIETGQGSFNLSGGLSEGDWLMFYDSADRCLLYSIKTGELKHRFFGKFAALNPVKNQIAIENFPGEVTLFNLETGESENKFVLNGEAVFLRFNLAGTQLFILSNNQNAYAFDLTKKGK